MTFTSTLDKYKRMNPKATGVKRSTVANSALSIPAICFGTSGLGNMPGTYGYAVSEQEAVDTLLAVFASDAPFVDTSRNYGMGDSEHRIGLALAELGGLPDNAVISTKLDRDMGTGRFDASRARESLEESLKTMGVERVQILHLHDPEHAASLDEIVKPGGALDELVKMKEEGLADTIGLAAGNIELMLPIVRDWDLDALVTHNRYTLLNRSAQPLLDLAEKKSMAVMNAAPYGSGVLVKGSQNCTRYVYQDIADAQLKKVQAIEKIAQKYSVSLGAIALQFSVRSPQVQTTVCGVTKPERIAQTINSIAEPIPAECWAEIEELPFDTNDPEATRQYNPS